MKTEQQIKSRLTPDIIKRMCELAEGFNIYIVLNRIDFKGVSFPLFDESSDLYFYNTYLFPLLVHRAVEGWNDKSKGYIRICYTCIEYQKDSYPIEQDHVEKDYEFGDYPRENLTACECALLDCIIDVIEEEMR